MNMIFDSAGGRKMALGILGLIGVTILAALRVIDGPQAVDTIKWIIISVAGALAVSDIGAGLAAPKVTAPDPVVPPVIQPVTNPPK